MGSFQDGLGEVIAAAAALAHDMVNAQGIMVDQLLHRGGQVIGRGRGGKAIRGNGQPGAGGVCGGVQHGGNKIPPDAVHPGAAHDQVAVAQRAHKLFARKLAFTIQAFRGGGIELIIGVVARLGKHIIGGELHHLGPQRIGGKGQIAGGQGVDAVSAVGVRLAAVLIIKAGAVDDDIRAVGIRKGADFGGDSHIHFRHIGGDQLVFFAVKPCTQRLTKMAVGTADPNFEHCCFPPSGTGQ